MALTKIPGSLINSADNLTITDLTVTGNLSVTGTSTTLETATLQVEDKNIVLNYGSGDTSASADGAGITIQDAVDASNDASLTWDASLDKFDLSHSLTITESGSATNSVADVLRLNHITSGTAASGLGAGVVFSSERPSGGLNLTRSAIYGISGSDPDDDGALAFYTRTDTGGSGFSEKMRIDSSGNVLIGDQTSIASTLGDFAQLQVSHATAGGIIINTQTAGSSNYGRLMFSKANNQGNEGLIRYNTGDYHMAFWTDAAERMRIDSSGNVGIGRTSPGAKLDVNGSMYVDNIELQDASGLGIGAVSGAGVSVGHTASVNEGIFWHTANDQYGIYRTSGAWSGSNYQQLKAYWDTGIILDGGVNYGLSGVSFQTNGTERVMIDQNAISLTHTGNTGESNQQPDVAKTTRAGIHFKVPSSGSSAGITWEAGSAGDTQAGYVVHNNNSDGTHHGWFSTNTYSGGPYCRMKLSNYGNLILGSSIDVGSVSASQFNTVHVHYGDIFCNATSSAHSLSDLLPGYSRGTYGCLKANGAYIYFSVNGSYVSYINSSGTYATSDERLKENITTLTGSLDKIKQLRGVNFTWIDTERKGSETHIGLLAQEVEPHFPEVVGDGGLPHPDDENEEPYKNVNYAALVPALVEAIKELEARVAELEG